MLKHPRKLHTFSGGQLRKFTAIRVGLGAWTSSPPVGFTIVKHKVNIIMNLTSWRWRLRRVLQGL
jgi:hypothetical protein